jgi:predicted flap endonuclease-1-like 5' DNA nuclease
VAWFIGQSILIIAAAFLLGILVGWLIWGRVWRRRSEAETQTPVAAAEAEPAAAGMVADEAVAAEPVAVAAEPVPVSALAVRESGQGKGKRAVSAQAPEQEVPEDLERIEGIGPKMAGALHKAGIRTFTQLASADEATLRQATESQGLRFAPSLVTWGRQAQLLADGDEEGFAELTRRLVAGRDEGRE